MGSAFGLGVLAVAGKGWAEQTETKVRAINSKNFPLKPSLLQTKTLATEVTDARDYGADGPEDTDDLNYRQLRRHYTVWRDAMKLFKPRKKNSSVVLNEKTFAFEVFATRSCNEYFGTFDTYEGDDTPDNPCMELFKQDFQGTPGEWSLYTWKLPKGAVPEMPRSMKPLCGCAWVGNGNQLAWSYKKYQVAKVANATYRCGFTHPDMDFVPLQKITHVQNDERQAFTFNLDDGDPKRSGTFSRDLPQAADGLKHGVMA